jgi:demethylmenaquinone methyltransferase/2-methoxy-6-polyprenyl-1,4-benzoquinol methylase
MKICLNSDEKFFQRKKLSDLEPKKTNFVFDPIAGRYDRCNHLFSLGLDRRWRKALVRELSPAENESVLDLCCGTGDVVFSVVRHTPARAVTGADLSESMLHLAQEKQILFCFKKWMRNAYPAWVLADVANTSFDAASFDVLTCAFGIRNVTDRLAALAEFSRLLKPSGRIGILEFSIPSNRLLRTVYLFYLKRLMPSLGGFLLRDRRPLDYLAASIDHWHNQVNFAQDLMDNGFMNIRQHPLTAGIVTLWLAQKRPQ